ncbi:T9SS type A sorting domain-containing protein [bacterium]|nr:T9SS type A sorting domain-containing protein [bacterium]
MFTRKIILFILSIFTCPLLAQPAAPYEPDPITTGLWHMDYAEPESLWTITIGEENEYTNLGSVIKRDEHTYLICGSSIVDTISSMLLMKIDEDGDVRWSRNYPVLSSAIDLVIVGDTSIAALTYGNDVNDFYILITDLDGDSLTCFADSVGEEGWFSDMEVTDDGGFLLAGTCFNEDYTSEMWVVKLDSSGQVEWSSTYDCGGAQMSSCEGILRVSEDSYLIYGESDFNGYMIELDLNSDIIWQRRYGDGISCWINSVVQNEDVYYCAGNRLVNSWDYWLLFVGENGNEQGSSAFGSNRYDSGEDIIMTLDNNTIIAGIDGYLIDNREYFRYDGDMGLVKTDREGGVIWRKTFGDDSHEEAHQVFQCKDNSYLLFGTTTVDTNTKIRIIRTTPDLDVAADVSGNMNRGELIGSAVQTDDGRWNEALDLTDENYGCMRVEDAQSLHPDILTVECWFLMSDWIPQTGALVNKTRDVEYSSFCLYASNERDKVTFLIDTDAHEFFVEYETEPDDGHWHHIAGTFDDRDMKLYYDGWLVGELDASEAIDYDNCPLLIGSDYAGGYGDYQFHGLIDEVRISDYPREFHHGVERFPDAQIPTEFAILNVYPNPFNSTATVRYSLSLPTDVSLTVYDPLGRSVVSLFKGYKQAGFHFTEIITNDLPSGLYFVRLEASDKVFTRKVMLIR